MTIVDLPVAGNEDAENEDIWGDRPEDHLAAPASYKDISRQWLGAALAINYPGVEVTHVTIGREVHATGTKIRLLLEYNEAGHRHRLPPTLWLKGGYEPHSDIVKMSHISETLFYRYLSPLGLLNAPRCYYAGIDRQRQLGVQLIEDLLQRNVMFGDARKPISVDTAAKALSMLARLHAHWWASPSLARLGEPGGSHASDGILLRLVADGAWEPWMSTARAQNLPAELRRGDNAVAALKALWAYDRSSKNRCLVHGDPHPGNMFYEQDGTPGFLDWQRLMQCDWGHDVSYFLIGSLSIDDCERAEKELLAFYLEQIKSLGVPPISFEEGMDSYRKHVMHGLVWLAVPNFMQPEGIVQEESLRYGAAAERLGTYRALLG
jgi:hypothetical protein